MSNVTYKLVQDFQMRMDDNEFILFKAPQEGKYDQERNAYAFEPRTGSQLWLNGDYLRKFPNYFEGVVAEEEQVIADTNNSGLTFKPNGNLAKFLMWSFPIKRYSELDLPKDVCSLFFSLLLSVAFLPFTWPLYVVHYRLLGIKPGVPFVIKILLGVALQLWAFLSLRAIYYMTFRWEWLIADDQESTVITTAIGVILAILALGLIIDGLFKSKRAGEISKLIGAKIEGAKKNYCARVEWKEEQK